MILVNIVKEGRRRQFILSKERTGYTGGEDMLWLGTSRSCRCQMPRQPPLAILDKISLKIQHVCQGGQLGLWPRAPPFCVKSAGAPEAWPLRPAIPSREVVVVLSYKLQNMGNRWLEGFYSYVQALILIDKLQV